jgi:hypothetical protein
MGDTMNKGLFKKLLRLNLTTKSDSTAGGKFILRVLAGAPLAFLQAYITNNFLVQTRLFIPGPRITLKRFKYGCHGVGILLYTIFFSFQYKKVEHELDLKYATVLSRLE